MSDPSELKSRGSVSHPRQRECALHSALTVSLWGGAVGVVCGLWYKRVAGFSPQSPACALAAEPKPQASERRASPEGPEQKPAAGGGVLCDVTGGAL